MNINGNLFRNEELALILLPQILETWQKRLWNPWAQLISMGHLWPHQLSGLSPLYLLDFGKVVLGSKPVSEMDGDTKYLHLDSVHSYLPFLFNWNYYFCWSFLKWNDDFPDCSQLIRSNTCILWSWHPVAAGQGRGQTEGLTLLGNLALCIFTMYRKWIYSGFTHPPTGSLRNQ